MHSIGGGDGMKRESQWQQNYMKRYNLKAACFTFPIELLEKFKIACEKNGKSRTQVLIKAMEDYVRENTQEVS